MLGCARKIAAAAAAMSLGVAPGVAAPAPIAHVAAPAPPAIAPAPPANPWLTLSTMTASTSISTESATAQGASATIGWPNIAPLSVVLGTIATAIYILIDEDNDSREGGGGVVPGLGLRPAPLSPA